MIPNGSIIISDSLLEKVIAIHNYMLNNCIEGYNRIDNDISHILMHPINTNFNIYSLSELQCIYDIMVEIISDYIDDNSYFGEYWNDKNNIGVWEKPLLEDQI